MKRNVTQTTVIQLIFVAVVFLFASCSTSIELASSWKKPNVTVKPNPKIVVMTVGKVLSNVQKSENELVAELKKKGQNAVAALDIMTPGVKYDSVALLNLLKENKVDYILINTGVSKKESERYIPGETYTTPVTTTTPYNYYPNYNSSFYYYYGYQTGYYNTTAYETRTTEGYTVVDVEVLLQSNWYDVSNAGLIWVAQSKAFTDKYEDYMFVEFSKLIVKNLIDKQMITPVEVKK